MLRLLRRFLLTLAALAVFAVGLMISARVDALLPGEGNASCFTAAPNGGRSIIFGRAHEAARPSSTVEAVQLKLSRAAGQTPFGKPGEYRFDWRYDFALDVTVKDKGNLHAGGQCDWIEDGLNRIEFSLSCFIDCDGGALNLVRVPASGSLLLSLDQLRMGACGEPSTYVSSARGTMMWLQSASHEQCD
jgi:hypothetical protein